MITLLSSQEQSVAPEQAASGIENFGGAILRRSLLALSLSVAANAASIVNVTGSGTRYESGNGGNQPPQECSDSGSPSATCTATYMFYDPTYQMNFIGTKVTSSGTVTDSGITATIDTYTSGAGNSYVGDIGHGTVDASWDAVIFIPGAGMAIAHIPVIYSYRTNSRYGTLNFTIGADDGSANLVGGIRVVDLPVMLGAATTLPTRFKMESYVTDFGWDSGTAPSDGLTYDRLEVSLGAITYDVLPTDVAVPEPRTFAFGMLAMLVAVKSSARHNRPHRRQSR